MVYGRGYGILVYWEYMAYGRGYGILGVSLSLHGDCIDARRNCWRDMFLEKHWPQLYIKIQKNTTFACFALKASCFRGLIKL